MEPIAQWLEALGLGRYAGAFVAANVDPAALRDLDDAELQHLGVSLGHRKKILRAIAGLDPAATAGPIAARLPVAERRQLTVAFCDLVGSTAMAAQLDPEDLHALIRAYHQFCAEVIQREGGFVAKYMGDGVLAYFGYPTAHEDDAERAVRAGLALADAIAELDGGGRPCQVRVGIATGLVVVGDLIGEGAAREQGVVGETPNLAARLQALAEPNSVVIADSTCRLLGRLFDYRDLGATTLKGFGAPTRVWQVLSRSKVASRFEALRSSAIPLVGRAEEIELLLRRWTQARAGEGQVVLLAGEPGIGKSRLTATLLARIAAEPHLRARYYCSPHRLDSALYPFIQQLEHVAGFELSDPAEIRLAKLEALLQPLNVTTEHVGLLAAMLSIPFSASPVPVLNRKEKTFEACIAVGAVLAATRPLLIVFEDVHWIDPTSRELLGLTVERVTRWPVLVLITARPEFRPQWPAAAHTTTLVLSRLSRPEAAALVGRIAGQRALPAEVQEQILARADGVPLFLEELTRSVLESGHLHEIDGRYVFEGPLPPVTIPATLQDLLMARLDRLGPAREVAQIGSALGRRFSYELISAVAALPLHLLDDALEQLAGADVLLRRGAPPDAEYTFRHALVQDAAYATLLRGRRQPLHARIAAALEAQFPDIRETQPEVLAHHFTEARLAERAVGYWLQAGRQMLSRSGMAEAEALLNKGLGVLSGLPDSPQRREQELDLQIALAQALIATHGYGAPAVGLAYARARQLCDELDQRDKLPSILHGHATHHSVRGELQQSGVLAAKLRDFAETQNDPVTRVMACRAYGFTALYSGRFTEARASLEQGLALYRPSDQSAYAKLAIQDALVALLGFLSVALACCGHLDQARARSDAALAEARRIAHAHSLAHALAIRWRIGWLARSEPASLLPYADELLATSATRGFALWHAFALAHRGWCLAALGDAAQGIPLLNASLAETEATGAGYHSPQVLLLLGDACRMAGQTEIALGHLEEGARRAERMQVEWLQAETLRLHGEVLTLARDVAGAEASYRAAVRLARDQDGKLLELRASTSLARLWRDQGRSTAGRELLAPIAGWFSADFDALDIHEARALLLQLGRL